MKPLLGTAVLVFIWSFHGIESSRRRNISTDENASDDDKDSRKIAHSGSSGSQSSMESDSVMSRNVAHQYSPEQAAQGITTLSHPDMNYFSYTGRSRGVHFGQKRGRKNIKNKHININRNMKYGSDTPDVQIVHEKFHQRLTEREHSPIRSTVVNEEMIPEDRKKEFESIQVFHKHYGFPKDDDGSYRRFLGNYFGGSGSGSGK